MTTATKLAHLAETKTLFHDAIISAGGVIPEGAPFRDYLQYITLSPIYSIMVDLYDGLPVYAAFSRVSTKTVDDEQSGTRILPSELPDYQGMRLIDHADGQDYGFNVLGYEYVTTDNGGGSLPGPFIFRLDSVDGATAADGLSVDLSSHTDEKIKAAKIRYYDELDNLIVEDLFGASIIVNGDISNGTNSWVEYSGSSPVVENGKLKFNTNGQMGVYQDITAEAKDYLLTFSMDMSNKTEDGGHHRFSVGDTGVLGFSGDLLDGSNAVYGAVAAGNKRVYMHTTNTYNPLGFVLLDDVEMRPISDLVSLNWDTKILTFNTPLNLAAQNPIVFL